MGLNCVIVCRSRRFHFFTHMAVDERRNVEDQAKRTPADGYVGFEVSGRPPLGDRMRQRLAEKEHGGKEDRPREK